MRRILAPLLLGVGAFCLTTALLLLVWVPGQVKKTPLDTNSITRLSGEAAYLKEPRVPVKAISRTVADGSASTGDTVVFQTFTCLVRNKDGQAGDCASADGQDSRLINAGTDAFATDRVSGLAVADQEKYLGADASPHEGLINKFPFDTEKKTYPFWDGILDKAVDATFQGEEEVLGLPTYKFNILVEKVPAEISSGIQGIYSIDKTLWIDPVTGAIMKQQETQLRTLPDGDNALSMDLAFADETVQATVDSAKQNGGKLGLVGRLPWIAGLIGLAAIALGLILARIGGRREPASEPAITSESARQSPARFGEPPAQGETAAGTGTAAPVETTTPRRVTLEKE